MKCSYSNVTNTLSYTFTCAYYLHAQWRIYGSGSETRKNSKPKKKIFEIKSEMKYKKYVRGFYQNTVSRCLRKQKKKFIKSFFVNCN